MTFEEYEIKYWKGFNKFARIIGYAFFFGGLFGFVITCLYIYDPSLFPANEVYEQSVQMAPNFMNRVLLVVSVLVTIFGFLMLKAKPYYPKHIGVK